MGFILFIGDGATSIAAIHIPLTVNEALPLSVSGINRKAEITTGGIPLPENSGITSVSQLGLSGASSGQFRVLGRWRNGNIKWVQVDFPLTLNAGVTSTAVTLVDGTGNFGGSNLAVDSTSTITVTTGTATFSIKKANFNIFDTVTVGSTPLVTTGNAGKLRIVGGDSVDYYSSNDANSTAVVEENGPVRAVIKATGQFKSSGGVRLMDYTVRLHFYKGQSKVKGVISIKNASKTNAKKAIAFKSVEAIVPVTIGASKTVTFGRYSSNVAKITTAALPESATAYLFQGYKTIASETTGYNITDSGGPANAYGLWAAPLPTRLDSYYREKHYDPAYWGLKIAVGGTTLHNFGSPLDWSDSVGSMNDSSGNGVTVAYRLLSDYWPGGFEFKDSGASSIELYSKYNDGADMTSPSVLGPLYIQFGMHDTREVMWDFHVGSSDDQATKYALEYPLVARADLAHYNDTNVLMGSKLATVAEEVNFFNTESKAVYPVTEGPPSSDNIVSAAVRGWYWGSMGGGFMQQNYVGAYMTKWLRTGHGGYYLMGKNRAAMEINSAIVRRDDFTADESPTIAENGVPYYFNSITTRQADGEHRYLYTIPIYYYLTGDEDAKEAFLTLGDTMRNTTYYPLNGIYGGRSAGNTLRNAVIGYEFSCETGSCNNAIKTAVETEIARKLDTIEDPQHRVGPAYYGRNMDRGFIYDDNNNPYSYVHAMYGNTILMDALYHTQRVAASGWWSYSRLLELDDLITGFAKFNVKEYFRGPASTITTLPTAWNSEFAIAPRNATHGQFRNYLYHAPTTTTNFTTADIAPVAYGTQRAAIWAYQQEPLSKYLGLGYATVWENSNFFGPDEMKFPSEFPEQTMMYYYSRQSEIPVWNYLAISTQDNGGGSYTLSWTVPTGAAQIRIKHSSKTIVEWLEFNGDTQTFGYDPATYTPYFAATNTVQPTPATAGTTQTVTVTGLPVGLKFVAKCLVAQTEAYLQPKAVSAPAAPLGLKSVK